MSVFLLVVGILFSCGAGAWEIKKVDDPMTDKVSEFAAVVSMNGHDFDFPFNDGKKHAVLAAHRNPGKPERVAIAIMGGMIGCESRTRCKIRCRFDDDSPVTVVVSMPRSGDWQYAQLLEPFDEMFIILARKAKRVRIELPIYKNGSRVFEFDVAGYPYEPVPKKATQKGAKAR